MQMRQPLMEKNKKNKVEIKILSRKKERNSNCLSKKNKKVHNQELNIEVAESLSDKESDYNEIEEKILEESSTYIGKMGDDNNGIFNKNVELRPHQKDIEVAEDKRKLEEVIIKKNKKDKNDKQSANKILSAKKSKILKQKSKNKNDNAKYLHSQPYMEKISTNISSSNLKTGIENTKKQKIVKNSEILLFDYAISNKNSECESTNIDSDHTTNLDDSTKKLISTSKQSKSSDITKQDSLDHRLNTLRNLSLSFDKSKVDQLIAIFQDFTASSASSTEVINFIEITNSLISTPYFCFAKFAIRNALLKILITKLNCPSECIKQIKNTAADILIDNFCSLDIFEDAIRSYNLLDTYKVVNTTFRNSFLCRLLNKCLELDLKDEIFELINSNPIIEEYHFDDTKADHRNTVSLKDINTAFKTRKKAFLFESLTKCIDILYLCPPLVDHLCRSLKNYHSRYIIILIFYRFLKNTNVDLLRIKSINDVKDIDDTVISKIFVNFKDIFDTLAQDSQIEKEEEIINEDLKNFTQEIIKEDLKNFTEEININDLNKNKKCKTRNKDSLINTDYDLNNHKENRLNKISLNGKEHHNFPNSSNNTTNNTITNTNTGKVDSEQLICSDKKLNMKEKTSFKTDIQEKAFDFDSTSSSILLLKYLFNRNLNLMFGSSDLKKVLLSIYKRLFFFFIYKNKKIFNSMHVFNIFTKEEKTAIYKNIKTYKGSFLNIFIQIDQKYVVKYISQIVDGIKHVGKDSLELAKGDSNIATGKTSSSQFLQIFYKIAQDKLSRPNLKLFYLSLLKLVDVRRDEMNRIRITNSSLFAFIYKSFIDKSFINYLEVELKTPDISNTDTLLFIIDKLKSVNDTQLCNSEHISKHESNRKDITTAFNFFNIDLIAVVSQLIDTFNKNTIEVNRLLLRLIREACTLLNKALIDRLTDFLTKIIVLKDFTLEAGLLLRKISDYHSVTVSILHHDIKFNDDKAYTLMIKAALGHYLYEENMNSLLKEVTDLENIACDNQKLENINNRNNDTEISGHNTWPIESNLIKTDVQASIDTKSLCETASDLSKISIDQLISKYQKLEIGYLFNSVIFYSYYDPVFLFKHKELNELILLQFNQNTANFLDLISNDVSAYSSVILENLQILYRLYDFFVVDNLTIRYPFRSMVIEILFKSLKSKILLPVMAIPHIISKHNSFFIFKYYLNNVIDCINDLVEVIRNSIKIKYQLAAENEESFIDDSSSIQSSCTKSHDISHISNSDNNQSNSEIASILSSSESFENLLKNELSHNFLKSLSKKISLKKIIDKVRLSDDFLTVFIFLRLIKDFNSLDRNLFYTFILENSSDERILKLLDKAKEFYEQKHKEELPVDFLQI